MITGNNIVIMKGRLGEDPKIAMTQSGKSSLTISIAVYQGKDGEQAITEWFKWRMYGNIADRIGTARKGDTVRLIGRCRNEVYTDAHGNKKYANYMIADDGEVIPKYDVTPGVVPNTWNVQTNESDINNDELPF